MERNQAERQADIKDLGGMLQKFGDGIKKAIEKRQAEQVARYFSMPVEDTAVHSFSVPTSLKKPQQMSRHGDKVRWFWLEGGGCSVIATLTLADSLDVVDSVVEPVVEGGKTRLGSRAGEWTVDVVGPSGGALFRLDTDAAKAVGEAVLSAVYWRFAYLEYIEEYQESEEKGGWRDE